MYRFRYIAFHKPYGVLSQFTGEPGQRTLAEFGLPSGVYAAGRRDKDSEGLRVLSDDGVFIKRITVTAGAIWFRSRGTRHRRISNG